MTGPALAYDLVDVFTDRPYAGNQLAVVHDAAELSTAQCLAVARELNLSETTFPVKVSGAFYAVRIFTPGGEIPFAGHPTLGTAWVLRHRGVLDAGATEVVQACGAGDVDVAFGADDTVTLTAAPRDLAGPLPRGLVEDLLADVGLEPGDLAGEAYVAGAGLSFVHLPVHPRAVHRAHPTTRPLTAHRGLSGLGTADPVEGIDVHAVTAREAQVQVHARVFCPGVGVAEDPATGSSAAGLGMALVARGVLPEGGRYTVSQGAEVHRPSVIHGRVEAEGGRAVRCHVGGGVHPVGSGQLSVPLA